MSKKNKHKIGPVSQLLDHPYSWTKFAFCRDLTGKKSNFENACSFCLSGAILKAYPKYNSGQIEELENKCLREIRRKTGKNYHLISSFNDAPTTKFEDVKEIVTKLGI